MDFSLFFDEEDPNMKMGKKVPYDPDRIKKQQKEHLAKKENIKQAQKEKRKQEKKKFEDEKKPQEDNKKSDDKPKSKEKKNQKTNETKYQTNETNLTNQKDQTPKEELTVRTNNSPGQKSTTDNSLNIDINNKKEEERSCQSKPTDKTSIANDMEVKKLPPEMYYGNREYKLMLANITKDRLEGLITQMKFRLEEGQGECYYMIGVEDDGNPLGLEEKELTESLEVLKVMSERLKATFCVLNENQGMRGKYAEVMITVDNYVCGKKEIKIGLYGDECSGKSTTIGVLVSGKLDDGKGLSRTNVFRYKHELECGKTTSMCHQIVGFDEKGRMTNKGNYSNWTQIVENSVKIINFFDMGGSMKRLGSNLTTLNPHYLDYIFIVIAANKGLTKNDEYFLNVANKKNVPIIFIITKIDMVKDNETIPQLLEGLEKLMKGQHIQKNILTIRNSNDVVLYSRNLDENIIPTFMISNKCGTGLNEFVNFLNILPSKGGEKLEECDPDEVQFDILETITDEQRILTGGILIKGFLLHGQKYFLGPFEKGDFKYDKYIISREIEIKGMHCKRIETKYIYRGQYCSLLITGNDIKPDSIRKGMVLVSKKNSTHSVKTFEAEIWTINSSENKDEVKEIPLTYRPVLSINNIRRIAKFKPVNEANCKKNEKSETFLCVGHSSKIKVIFEFDITPEYVFVGDHLLINDNLLNAYGIITKTY